MPSINYDNKCNCAGREVKRSWLARFFLGPDVEGSGTNSFGPASFAADMNPSLTEQVANDSRYMKRITELTRQNTLLTQELAVTRYAAKKAANACVDAYRPPQPGTCGDTSYAKIMADPRACPTNFPATAKYTAKYTAMSELLSLNKHLTADLKEARSTANAYSTKTEELLAQLKTSKENEAFWQRKVNDGAMTERSDKGSSASTLAENAALHKRLAEKDVEVTAMRRQVARIQASTPVLFDGQTAEVWCRLYKGLQSGADEMRARKDATIVGLTGRVGGLASRIAAHDELAAAREKRVEELKLALADTQERLCQHRTAAGQNGAISRDLTNQLEDARKRNAELNGAIGERDARINTLERQLKDVQLLEQDAQRRIANIQHLLDIHRQSTTQLNERLAAATHKGGDGKYWHLQYESMRVDHARISALLRSYVGNGTTMGEED